MKLFIWSNPYHVGYGSTMLMVVAEDVSAAKKLAMSGASYHYTEYGQEGVPMNAAQIAALGEPTRIVDLPCAEWHMWSE